VIDGYPQFGGPTQSRTALLRLNKWSFGMRARALIDGAVFDAETLKAIGAAFDQAWARIAPTFGNLAQEIEAARLRLAEAMLSVATEGNTNIADLKDRAIEEMAKHYSSRIRR